jgi:hypothetical protein
MQRYTQLSYVFEKKSNELVSSIRSVAGKSWIRIGGLPTVLYDPAVDIIASC